MRPPVTAYSMAINKVCGTVSLMSINLVCGTVLFDVRHRTVSLASLSEAAAR